MVREFFLGDSSAPAKIIILTETLQKVVAHHSRECCGENTPNLIKIQVQQKILRKVAKYKDSFNKVTLCQVTKNYKFYFW